MSYMSQLIGNFCRAPVMLMSSASSSPILEHVTTLRIGKGVETSRKGLPVVNVGHRQGSATTGGSPASLRIEHS